MADLLARWLALFPDGSPTVDQLGADLLTRWAEPHRHYHDVWHLQSVLDAVDVLADAAGDAGAVRLAAWFHDAVHHGRAGEDEEASARLAEQTLPGAGVSPARTAEVARLVRLTATHDPGADDANAAVLCDADLAVLGGNDVAYAEYAELVRAEYRHVPADLFGAGRAAVLRDLLQHRPLFRTAEGRRRWEAAARQNLTAELATLG